MGKVNILLVDDQPANLLAFEGILEPLGENLVSTNSGADALRAVREQDFAVILLDVQMQGMSGLETANRIKQEKRSASTPIIFLTGVDTTEAHVFKGYAAGAVDYLIKPIVPEILVAKVSVFIELYRKNALLEQQITENTRLLENIVKHRQAEANLLEQNHWFRTTLASIGDAVIATDTKGRIAFLNPVAECLSGWRQSEAIGKELQVVFNIVNQRTRLPADNPIERVLAEGVSVGLANHTVLIAKDGTEIPIDDSGAPIRDDSGVTAGAVLVFRDITEQQSAQQLQAKLAAIVESSDDAIISKDLNGIITSWNSGAQQMYGYTPEEIIGQPIVKLIPPDWPNDVPQILERIKRGERIVHYETKRMAKDGRVLDVSLSISPVYDSEGNVIGASKIARDITEQKRFQTIQAQIAAIVESADDAIISKDLNGIITSWNSGAQQMYGYTPEEIIGQPIATLIPPDWPNDVPQILERIKRGERVVHYETKRMAKDGRVLDVSLSVSPVRDSAGNVIGASKIARDITERKLRERELTRLLEREQQARAEAEQAVQSRNEFLSVAAHELKTPVTSLRGFAETILRRMERTGSMDPERTRQALVRIDEQSKKLASLVNRLLDISRIEAGRLLLERRWTNISTLVQEVIVQAQSTTTTHTISLQAESVVDVNLDPMRFEQVIANLLDNAIKYSPDGGGIEVEIARPTTDDVRIAVTDEGVGVGPEHREHLFERFYQAHQEGYASGMGLGLYISRQIVELHGGRLWAEFPDEGGTRFVVTLPTNPTM